MALFVGTMIKNQPLLIKGIDQTNQEITKESAFGAMGMFAFIFASSVLYLYMHRNKNDEHAIRSRGYMRPTNQHGLSDFQVEMPFSSVHGDDDDVEEDELEEDEEEVHQKI